MAGAKKLDGVPKDTELVLYCLSGSRSNASIKILKEMGMIAAAVTSPLKLVAYEHCDQTTALAQAYQSVNTLTLTTSDEWLGHNTDEDGMRALKEAALNAFSKLRNKTGFDKNQSLEERQNKDVPQTKEDNVLSDIRIAVWGGGGTLPLLRKQFTQAEFFSIQTGFSRENKELSKWSPDIVVWAGGRLQEEGVMLPPVHWLPLLIVDLNYREDSGGREFALKVGAKYLSGEVMFYAQADAQQIFWSKYHQGSPVIG